ncbi:MAG: SDR family oxidoreductase [Polyangiales bacterium]
MSGSTQQERNRETVVLTGLPTLLARRVAERVLEAPSSRVIAVVRSKFREPARAFVEKLPEHAKKRIELLDGDAAAMDLGLSGQEFKRLAAEVDVINHAAQVSWLAVDERTAEAVNVRATREALELARAATHLRAFVHHSTTFVSGDRRGLVLESELDVGQKSRNPVELTKLRAEKIVRAASKDVPTVILRPSIVVGDSKSGEVDRLDGPYLLVLLMLTAPPDFALPVPTEGDALLHLVPVDYVAAASVAIGRDPRAIGQTFHLVDKRPVTVRSTVETLARAAGRRTPRGFIPANLTRAILRTPGIDRFAKSPRAFLDQLATAVQYSAKNTEAILAGTGIEAPSFESYADVMVAHVRGRLTAERRHRQAGAESEVEDPLV